MNAKRQESARPAVLTAQDLLAGGDLVHEVAVPEAVEPPAVGSKAVPLRLTESRPRVGTAPPLGPLSKAEGHAPSASRQVSAPGFLPPELAPDGEAPEGVSEPYGSERIYGERAEKVVEWPATRPVPAGGAAPAAPGNVLREMEEWSGSDPDLPRLRGRLEVEEAKRHLRHGRAHEVPGEGPEEGRAYVNATNGLGPAAQPPTSFSPLTHLLSKNVARAELSKNVARAETAADPVVQEPEVMRGGDSTRARRRAVEEEQAPVRRVPGEEAGRRPVEPLVEEVLEELYERLRLEFSRTYGTTGG